jgi:hypothetical protein
MVGICLSGITVRLAFTLLFLVAHCQSTLVPGKVRGNMMESVGNVVLKLLLGVREYGGSV